MTKWHVSDEHVEFEDKLLDAIGTAIERALREQQRLDRSAPIVVAITLSTLVTSIASIASTLEAVRDDPGKFADEIAAQLKERITSFTRFAEQAKRAQ